LELTANLKLENCIYHKDVVDAMFRQTHSDLTIPFKNHLAKQGTTILAVDYDLGRNRFAYFDKDTANYWVANGGKHSSGNQGSAYRNDGVDISKQSDQLFVDHFEQDEWLQYTVTGSEEKTFSISLTLSNKSPGRILFECNGKTNEVNTAVSDQWHSITIKDAAFHSGKNVIRVKVLAGQFNFREIHFD
jgi:endoglucanase